MALGIFGLISSLAFFKYSGFGIEVLGISFFTFHTISYLIDVARGDVKRERNIIDYALYVCFFPQITAGPIAKSKVQLLKYKQNETLKFDFEEQITKSFLLIAFGFFMKLVIADRLAIYVNNVYVNLNLASGIAVILAIVLYSIQIYCDFAGYSLIAIGLANGFGIDLPVNFEAPYLSESLGEFWKRWHISLTSWFRDYVYIPLGGNRKGISRTYLNILVVFVLSGIWHGEGLTFLVWGLLHGVVQILERCVKFLPRLPRILRIIKTFIIVSIAWVFFRADSLGQALLVFKSIFNGTSLWNNDICAYGVTLKEWMPLIIVGVFLILYDVLKYKKIDIQEKVRTLKLPMRWGLYFLLIFAVIIFGIYGHGYDASNFIYNKF